MPKRKKATNRTSGAVKKVRRVVIDSSEESEADESPGPVESSATRSEKAREGVVDEDDEVLAEVGVFLLPANPNSAGQLPPSMVGFNRLQFPQQHPQLLGRLFAEGGPSGGKCQAHYKAQVQHLRLRFGEEEEEQEREPTIDNCFETRNRTSRGIADLLMRPSTSTTLQPAPVPSSSSNSSKSAAEVFTGEGHAQHKMLSHAVGFFSAGKLFMLPIDKTYEMRKPLASSSEKETSGTQKASKATSASSSSNAPNLAPLRIRFARPENEFQRRRREQSALFKQKLVDQDQWIPLRVERTKLEEMFEREIGQAEEEEEEQGKGAEDRKLTVKELLRG